MTARDYLRVLREGWIIIVACTVLATAGAAYVTLTKEPVYQATSTLAVSTCVAVDNSPVCDPVGGMSYAIQRARIYSTTATSLPVLRRTLELTDVALKRTELLDHTSVTQANDSPVIDVTATWDEPTKAADIANALAQSLVEYARESIDNFESEMTTVNFSIINEATPPTEPMTGTTRTIASILALGLIAGLGLALVRYLSDTRIRGRVEAEALTEIDVIGELQIRSQRSRKKPLLPAPTLLVDDFRRLRAAVAVRTGDQGAQSIIVAAVRDNEQSSDVAYGLAKAMSESGANIALLDFNRYDARELRSTAENLAAILSGKLAIDDALRQVDETRLFVLHADLPSDGEQLLASLELDVLVKGLRTRFDFIVISAGPVLTSADAVTLARLADGSLIVAGTGQTKRHDLIEALRELELAGTTTFGLALVK